MNLLRRKKPDARKKQCPECESSNVHEVITVGYAYNKDKAFADLDKYPIRPAMQFECQACKLRWENPAYTEYLLARLR